MGGEIIVKTIAQLQGGKCTFFGLCGSTTFRFNKIMDAAISDGVLDYVHCTNEISATLAAANFSKNNKIGVAITTRGPGMTMATTGLASADREELPMVYLSGLGTSTDYDVFQLLDTSIVSTITKRIFNITSAFTTKAEIIDVVEEAFHVAKYGTSENPGPGPVSLLVSDDVWLKEFNRAGTTKFRPYRIKTGKEKKALNEIIRRWNCSSKIILRLGSRISEDTMNRMVSFAERFPQLYITTVYDSRGMLSPDISNKYLGMSGPLGNSVVQQAMEDADLIIEAAIGVLYSLLIKETTDDRVIHLYDEPVDKEGYKVNADVVLEGLVYNESHLHVGQEWVSGDPTAAFGQIVQSYLADGNTIPAVVTKCVNVFYDEQYICRDNYYHVLDIGAAAFTAGQMLRVSDGDNLGNYSEYSPIGMSLGSAVGKMFSEPKDAVVYIGDGGFLTMLNGLVDLNEACHRNQNRVLVLYFDDQKYGNVAGGDLVVFGDFTSITKTTYLYQHMDLPKLFGSMNPIKYYDDLDVNAIDLWRTKAQGFTDPGLYVMRVRGDTALLHA